MEKVVGILGGGQLGRMLCQAASRLNIRVLVLDAENCPAMQINSNTEHVIGSYKDPAAIRKLAERCDVLTIEIEHVDTKVLEELSEGNDSVVEVQPSWRTIRQIQDKYRQKMHLMDRGIPTAKSAALETNSKAELERVGNELGFPFMLKSRTEAYDGRGNYPVKSIEEVPRALNALKDRPLYAEQWSHFQMELAVMVVKTRDEAAIEAWRDTTLAYPVVETIHENSICRLVYAPARNVSYTVKQKARDLARRAVAGFKGRGVFGVELFLLNDGDLLVNEIAPRPHNSGHHSIETCPISQYDSALRAILGLPIPKESLKFFKSDTNAIMLNLLGGVESDSHLQMAKDALSIPGVRLHLYGKGEARPGRKMGHVTVIAGTMKEAESRIQSLISIGQSRQRSRSSVDQVHHPTPGGALNALATSDLAGPPLVAVTMGSDSDRSVLKPGTDLLEELQIPYSVTITSAHRTPDRIVKFAKEAASKGIKVIIAAAGGTAALPGMIAALTPLPVIGVPVRASVLDGQDSLLSIVQLPKGCPVATVAINNSTNAAQLAVRILGATDLTVRMRLEKYLANQTKTVIEKAEKMEKVGIEAYNWEE